LIVRAKSQAVRCAHDAADASRAPRGLFRVCADFDDHAFDDGSRRAITESALEIERAGDRG